MDQKAMRFYEEPLLLYFANYTVCKANRKQHHAHYILTWFHVFSHLGDVKTFYNSEKESLYMRCCTVQDCLLYSNIYCKWIYCTKDLIHCILREHNILKKKQSCSIYWPNAVVGWGVRCQKHLTDFEEAFVWC